MYMNVCVCVYGVVERDGGIFNQVFQRGPDIWILNKFIGTLIDCLSICAVLAKYFIYCCKVKDCLPNIMSFKQKLKRYKSVELYSKFIYAEKKAEKITVRWSVLGPLLE